MNLPNREAWSVAAPHAPDCWCQFCFFHRLERVEAETDLALKRAQAGQQQGRRGATGFGDADGRK